MIYVADRRGNRIQAFRQNGEFVAEKIIEPLTRASGSAFVIALSPDPDQQWLHLADGTNHKVWTMRREDLEVVGDFGRGGRQVGQFLRPTVWASTPGATSMWGKRLRDGASRSSRFRAGEASSAAAPKL